MSRINHSCLPNAEYHPNWEKDQMELYSNTKIRAGEEVTICYGRDFDYKTSAERNAHLKCIYGFTCKYRACADPTFVILSDQRRRLLKNDFFCGMRGMRIAPDFSAKANGIDDPNSIQPARIHSLQGFPDGIQIFRPGTVQLMRRAVKLRYDEGLGGANLRELNCYATSALSVMHKRMVDARRGVPVDPLPHIKRCVQLVIAAIYCCGKQH
ncbi:hypothetical protein N431DRAFT_475135 [Stipitochalara longipes BDJ]|nr:hypothetical protein N431DRAFT_475135 [Stipitochalara longipes BDJ]